MKGYKIFSLIISVLVILSMSLSFVPAASAGQEPSPDPQTGGAELGYDPETGQLIFVGAPAGEVIAAADGVGPMAFVETYGAAFGLSDPSNELTALGDAEYESDTVTRYQQVYQNIPVFGGNLVVTTGEGGGLVAMAGKISSKLDVDVNPSVTPEQAIAAAQAVTLKTHKEKYDLKAENLSFSEPALWIYDEKLFTESVFGPQLVWKVDVTTSKQVPVHEVVLVNAHAGKVAVHYNKVDTQWETMPNAKPVSRTRVDGDVTALAGGTPLWRVYDNDNTWNDPSYTVSTESPVCAETSPDCPNWQATDAKTYLLDTYNFYWGVNGRDSIDDAGMRMISVVKYGGPFTGYINDPNWYYNAYWDGTKMVYGDWMAVDDVTAHELTHGVTEATSGLIYMYQPGAINESLSDVWGELVDLSYDHDYFPAVTNRWLMGEDILGPRYAIRNMKNPPAFRDPDKITSSYFYKGPFDNGGVHTNGGVNNKAAYLMTDGATFNGKTVKALGINKVAAIYYYAQTHLLFPSSNYLDLYYALKGACSNLIGTNGITSYDCAQVKNAAEAVQMNIKPTVITPTPVDACPLNYAYGSTLFNDDFESGLGNWTFNAYGDGFIITPSWQTTTTTSNILNDSTALWAPAPYGISVGNYDGGEESAAFTSNVSLPAGQQIYLTFDHMYLFEFGSKAWDGGVLEYSANGGAWTDAKPLFKAGANYNGTVYNYPYYTINPLEGRSAFVGSGRNESQTMLYNLTTLAGKNVRFRWRIGYDLFTDWGWFLDNVNIHTCVSSLPPAIPALSAPAANALLFDYTPLLNWSDVTTNLDHYIVQVSTDKYFDTLVYNENVGATSEFQVPTDLAPDTTYYWRVAAENSLDARKGWSLVRSFRTALVPPTALSPSGPQQTDRPDFDWTDSPDGVTGYTVQISTVDTFKSITLTGTIKTPTSQFTLPADLPINKTLWWRVKANGANPSNWSTPLSFSTVNPPTVPVLVAPAVNFLITDYPPRFDWKPSTISPVGSSTLGNYYLQVDDNADFSSPEIDNSTVPTDEFIPAPVLDPNTKYYWRVRSSNTAGDYSAWSAVRYFRMAMVPPTLESPIDGGSLHDLKPNFDWSDVPGAATYTIQLSKVTSFGSIYKTATVLTSAYTPPTNIAAGTYYWRVRANGANGPSLWSLTRMITVVSPGADTDGDGLPDYWEQYGYDLDGDGTDEVDLPALGANYLHKDIFVEMDYMPSTCGPYSGSYIDGLAPNSTVTDAIVAVFANAPVTNPVGGTGINIHLDLDDEVTCDADLNPVDSEFYALKAANFDPNRAAVYHYMIWAVGYQGGSSSGLSFGIPATDFIVTLGSWGTGGTDEQKIGTFIHELGHNLNLTHGGVDHNHYKPNYLSIMNYFFQTSGLYRNGAWGDSTANRLNFDYQRINVAALNETNLNETVGLGTAAAGYGTKHYCPNWSTRWDDTNLPKIDWNCDGDYNDTGLSLDVNGDGRKTTLAAQNNWQFIVYNGGGIIGSGLDPQVLLSMAENTPIVEWDELTLEMQQEIDAMRNSAP